MEAVCDCRDRASQDQTAATWGGSTADNLESIEEDAGDSGDGQEADDDNQVDDGYPSDGIVQVEEEEEEAHDSDDRDTYTIEPPRPYPAPGGSGGGSALARSKRSKDATASAGGDPVTASSSSSRRRAARQSPARGAPFQGASRITRCQSQIAHLSAHLYA